MAKVNKLCKKCIYDCKQTDKVIVSSCPKCRLKEKKKPNVKDTSIPGTCK